MFTVPGKMEEMGTVRRLERALRPGPHRVVFFSRLVLAEVVDFVNRKRKRVSFTILKALRVSLAEDEPEMARIAEFISRREQSTRKFNYQRNGTTCDFVTLITIRAQCSAELARLIEVPRENIFASGDHS